MPQSQQRSTLPLVVLPHPLILLPGARATFPITHKLADALIRLIDSSLTSPVLAAVPLVQHEGSSSLNRWGVTANITRFVRPRLHSNESYLLTLTGTARIRLPNPPPLPTTAIANLNLNLNFDPNPVPNKAALPQRPRPPHTGEDGEDGLPAALPRVDVVYPPPDAREPPASDVVQDFKVAAVRLLERFAQDTSQSARKRESWARIAQLVEGTEVEKAAALADAIVSAIGAEHADKLGECGAVICDLERNVPSSPLPISAIVHGILFCPRCPLPIRTGTCCFRNFVNSVEGANALFYFISPSFDRVSVFTPPARHKCVDKATVHC